MTAQDQNNFPPPEISLSPAPLSGNSLSVGKIVLFFIVGLLIFGAGCAAAYLFINKTTTSESTVIKPLAKIPSIATATPTPASNLPSHKLLYVKNQNIYLMDTQSNTEKPLTSDGSNLVNYRLPLWITGSLLSFERCQHADQNNTQPYFCTVNTLDLTNNITESLFSDQSKANVNGVQVGGDISLMSWSHDKNQLAFLAVNYTPQAKNFGLTELHVYNVSDKSDSLIFTHINTGGRGGSLDDDMSLHFSPDDSKILLNYTALYPGGSNTVDNGTLLVFDVGQKIVLWKMPATWTTFGRWLDNNSFIAKQFPNSPGNLKPGKSGLVSVDILQNKVTKITSADGLFNSDLSDKDNLISNVFNSESGTGIVLKKINLTTKSDVILKKNVEMVQIWPDGLIVVRTMTKCFNGEVKNTEKFPECGMDMFNGFMFNGLGILDPKTGEVTTLNISVTDHFDVTDIEGI